MQLQEATRLGIEVTEGQVNDAFQQVARNVSPFSVDPGKFTYRLVRGELEFTEYGRVEARCRVDQGPITVVPYTLLAPPEAE